MILMQHFMWLPLLRSGRRVISETPTYLTRNCVHCTVVETSTVCQIIQILSKKNHYSDVSRILSYVMLGCEV